MDKFQGKLVKGWDDSDIEEMAADDFQVEIPYPQYLSDKFKNHYENWEKLID
ncbi:hypothetical protein [Moorena producens]|uniref:hypothetical protein n=1 Tax=Moorena producens TaxID=1155739 RepID=UPI0013144C61|nr:hypothetical protein [Moorena producens]